MSSDTDERAAFEKWWKNQGWNEPTPFHYARLGWLARAAAEARADSAVPSSHVSETDQPILTRAQADRIVSALDPSDGGHDELAAFIYRLADRESILREALARLVALYDERAPLLWRPEAWEAAREVLK